MSMTPSSITTFSEQRENPTANDIGWVGWVIVIISMVIASQWEDWQENHQRRARLDAYRCRYQWRKADVSRLLNLGVPRQRIERVIANNRFRGRGVVQDYQSLDEMLMQAGEQISVLLSPDAPPVTRLKILKKTFVWPYVVESLYRGEHAAAREARQKSASTYAELRVAGCLGISDSQVHKICVGVRQERKSESKPSEGESMFRIQEFEAWMNSGELGLS